MQKHPGVINTGLEELDSTLTVLLSTTILVGGCLGCLLDNLIPGLNYLVLFIAEVTNSSLNWTLLSSIKMISGTREERGLIAWEKEMSLKGGDENGNGHTSSTFDFPFGMDTLRRYGVHIP